MGAHLYKKNETNGETISLSHIKAVRLSGKEGIIAKFVETHREQEDLEDWAMPIDEVCKLTDEPADGAVLLFVSPTEQGDALSVSIVKSLIGKSSIVETELLLMMQPILNAELTDVEGGYPSQIVYQEKQKSDSVFESLVIKGGISTIKHSWKLAPPKMQIGGMIRNRT